MSKRPVSFETRLNSTERIQVTFTDTSGTPTAPGGSVNFRQVTPTGTDSTVTSGWTNPSTGVYYRDVAFSTIGMWAMAAWATGTESEEYLVDVTSALP